MILGLPAMSQYDAAATPLWRCFTDTINAGSFKSIHSLIDLEEKNTAMNKWQRRSEEFDSVLKIVSPMTSLTKCCGMHKKEKPPPALHLFMLHFFIEGK